MFEVLYRATKYMNAEDVVLARGDKPRKRERQIGRASCRERVLRSV